jgi:hypothetical protein
VLSGFLLVPALQVQGDAQVNVVHTAFGNNIIGAQANRAALSVWVTP